MGVTNFPNGLTFDTTKYVSMTSGSTVPTTGAAGYNIGCVFIKTDVARGQASQWVNINTATSCLFVPTGPVFGYGIKVAGGPLTSTTGSASQSVSLEGLIMDSDLAFAGHEVSDDADQIIAAISNEGSIAITGSADPLAAHGYAYAALRHKCVPEWDIFTAGTHVTTGGSPSEGFTVAGVLATDLVFVNYGATNDTDTILEAICAANTITVRCSADPGTAHSFHYVVIRPRGTFKPSHYIVYAGTHTTVGGAAAEPVTITGALSTDIPIVIYNTTDDSDTILKVVMTTNTMTVTCSADPGAAHAFTYMLLRAY